MNGRKIRKISLYISIFFLVLTILSSYKSKDELGIGTEDLATYDFENNEGGLELIEDSAYVFEKEYSFDEDIKEEDSMALAVNELETKAKEKDVKEEDETDKEEKVRSNDKEKEKKKAEKLAENKEKLKDKIIFLWFGGVSSVLIGLIAYEISFYFLQNQRVCLAISAFCAWIGTRLLLEAQSRALHFIQNYKKED